MGQYHHTFAIPVDHDGPIITVDPHQLGSGLKLVEQFYTWTDNASGLSVASHYASAWAALATFAPTKYRIVTVGDYAEPTDNPAGWDLPFPACDLYNYDTLELTERLNEVVDVGEVTVEDHTAQFKARLSEAMGWTFEDGPGWIDRSAPEDLARRLSVLSQATIERPNMVLAVIPLGEWVDPFYLRSTPDPKIASVIGGLWPTVLALTAISDGRGGGDFQWSPELAGRWAYQQFVWVDRHFAETQGFTEITNQVCENTEVRYLTSGR